MPRRFNQWFRYGERKGESIIITNVGYTINKRGDTKYLRICKCGVVSHISTKNMAKAISKCQFKHRRA